MPESVLIIDDEKDFLEVMAERLKNRGFQVDTTVSAMTALEKISNHSYDAVILDLEMPEMDGLEALKRIKQKQSDIRVILMAGIVTVEKGVEASGKACGFVTIHHRVTEK